MRTGARLIQKGSALRWIADDLAGDVVSLLGSGAELVGWNGADVVESSRPVTPSDIGVLVRTNHQAVVVQAALRAVGVPVVVAGAQSVLSTPAARDWLRLLGALEQPATRSRAAAAALTPFLGLTAQQLAAADEGVWEPVHSRLYLWAAVVRREGVASLFGQISAGEGLPARLLAQTEGERLLTDLTHVAELLHAEAMRSQLGLAALRTWLARRSQEVSSEATEADQRGRRLDSGSEAVHILTVHRAKGQEFPIVYCPYLWDGAPGDRFGAPVMFHDAEDGDRRKLDVGGQRGGAVYERHFAAGQEERRGEDLRHLYVALTRAQHQATVWWAAVQGCQHSALGRLLLARDANGDVAARGRSHEPRDSEVQDRFRTISQAVPGLVSVELATGGPGQIWRGPGAGGHPADLRAAPFPRHLDLAWRRSSYTSITASVHGTVPGPAELVSSEPEETGTTDEPVAVALAGPARPDVPDQSDERDLRAVPSLLAAMPAGADVGTFVHAVLEAADFSAPDLASELTAAVAARMGGYPGRPDDAGMLVRALGTAITTPLGTLAGGARLRDVGRGDRLDELGFELPLVGGDQPAGEVTTAGMAALFARHLGPGQPLAGYAAPLAEPALAARLRGYLTGRLDLVFRLGGPGGRYFVADYKTNWLAPPGEALSAWHYRPVALEEEMCRSHYALQATLYLVALHRYLRWRLPAYEPDAHLGGALYLFVRGMSGPGPVAHDGQPCGVFDWRPPVALVTEMSDLFAGAPAKPGRD